MKILTLILSFLLSSMLLSQAQGHAVKSRLKAIANEFQSLSTEQQKQYVSLKKKAYKAKQEEKYFSCMIAIIDAQQIFNKDMDMLFLKGICRAQIHDVDNALKYYNEVFAIDPTHVLTLLNVIEINFFDARYQETVKYIDKMNKLIKSRANGKRMPLLDFKLLISKTKLAEANPEQHAAELTKLREKYTYMDDNPYYYYANALEAFDAGNKQEGLIWILKAYLIFGDPQMIETWNKALVDTSYIDAHEIMFNRQEEKK